MTNHWVISNLNQLHRTAAWVRVSAIGIICVMLGIVTAPASAQIMGSIDRAPASNQTKDISLGQKLDTKLQSNESLGQVPNINRKTGTYGPVPQTGKTGEPSKTGKTDVSNIPPFGADLFSGGFRGPMASGLNPHYVIQPGDMVTLRVWGAVDINSQLPVDAKGNIFIPYVGPVHVAGVTNSQLNATVEAAISEVFKNNVSVYTNLQGVQPVAVFVTGYVEKPGRYAGTPSASVLYYLDQASGIQQASGSYRDIRIVRDGRTIARVDLYDFLINGTLPDIQFQSGDTIVVEERGPVVTVAGDVTQPYRYELNGDAYTGQELLQIVQLVPGVTHALISGVRGKKAISAYMPLDEFRGSQVRAGDIVYFAADLHPDTITVQIDGSYKGPSRYVVPDDTTLEQLLNVIPIQPKMAAADSVFIRRKSVARRQKESLQDSLRRLMLTYLSAGSGTAKEASIRVQEAQLIRQFVQRASQVEPSGVLVVAHNRRIRDVRLQDGDEVVIPEESHTVLLTGEVLVPRAMIYVDGLSAREYIQRAGGFTNRANEERVMIVRQSGQVLSAGEVQVKPGDEIMVLPEAPTHNLQLAKTLTQIVFQIAVTAGTVLNL